MEIVYTLFDNAKATQGEPVFESLEAFAARCKKPYPSKLAQPLALPVVLPEHNRSAGNNPVIATSIFLDVDHATLTIDDAHIKLKDLGVAAVIYPTYSFTRKKQKYRIALPLSQPMELDEWLHVKRRYGAFLGCVAPESYDAKRGYFAGCKIPQDVYILNGVPADQAEGLPEVPSNPSRALKPASTDNPFGVAQRRFEELGRKLRDGDGRWGAVDSAMKLYTARNPNADESECRMKLDGMIATYFDAKHITRKAKEQWYGRIDYWCNKTQKSRQASPPAPPAEWMVFDLADTAEEKDTRKWLLDHILIIPGLITLAGTPKKGKTYLLLQFALCQAYGKKFLSFDLEPKPVFYFDNENGRATIVTRTNLQCRSLGITARPPGLFTLLSWGKNQSDTPRGQEALDLIRQRIIRTGAKLVIVDGLKGLAGENEKRGSDPVKADYESIRRLQRIAHETDSTMIVVLPDSKFSSKQEIVEDKITGTRGITAGSDGNLFLEIIPREEGYYATFKGGTRGGKELSAGLRRDDAQGIWTLTGTAASVEKDRPERQEVLRAIEEFEKEGVLATTGAIARKRGSDPIANSQLLGRMKKDGFVERQTNGSWKKLSYE